MRPAAALRAWFDQHCDGSSIESIETLMRQPRLQMRESVRRWLQKQGLPKHRIAASVLDRVEQMCTDTATPAAVNLPGNRRLRRRRGRLELDR